jgi:hypothetical protein
VAGELGWTVHGVVGALRHEFRRHSARGTPLGPRSAQRPLNQFSSFSKAQYAVQHPLPCCLDDAEACEGHIKHCAGIANELADELMYKVQMHFFCTFHGRFGSIIASLDCLCL